MDNVRSELSTRTESPQAPYPGSANSLPEGVPIFEPKDDDRGWWAVYTKHQHEKRIAEMLVHYGAEVFLPLYLQTRLWNKRKVTLSLPLFPSYLFVREDPRMRFPVISTPGVHLIVCHGGRDAVIPASEVENLRRAVQSPRGVQPHSFLKVGQKVRIVRGVLEGLEGILLRHKNSYQVVLSIDMLAQSAVVEVAERDLSPVAEISPTLGQVAHKVPECPDRRPVQPRYGAFSPSKPLNA